CPNPSCPIHIAVAVAALCRRRLSLPADSHPTKGWPPLRPAPSPLLVASLAAGDCPLRVPYSLPPLRAPCCKRVCPRAATTPACRSCPLASPLRVDALASGAGLPCGLLPLRAVLASLARGIGRGLAVGGRPSSLSSL
ncbi:hypothetical protein BHM03_00045975, partial [Ensete ventricosum]